MKTIKFILTVALIACSINSCLAQNEKKVTDKVFQTFLDRFRVVKPPINYKKIVQPISSMTKKEAIQFLHKTEKDLYTIEEDYDYDANKRTYYKREHTAGCDFKYRLNDSIYILCTREGGQSDTSAVYLSSFTLQGRNVDRCAVGEQFTYENDWISFVLLDKTHVRVFYYNHDDTRIKEGYRSTAYYTNYEIANNGKFIKKDKSDIVWLKEMPTLYNIYNPKSDDPMNNY